MLGDVENFRPLRPETWLALHGLNLGLSAVFSGRRAELLLAISSAVLVVSFNTALKAIFTQRNPLRPPITTTQELISALERGEFRLLFPSWTDSQTDRQRATRL